MKKKIQLLLLSILCVAFARAQYVEPSEGVFRIVNVAYDAALKENFETNTLHCTAIGDEDDFDQLWILKKSSSGYSLQNAYTGAYIQTGNTGTEVPYWTSTTPKTFNITTGGSKKGYNIFDPNLNKQGLHSKGGNGNVVRWVDCEASEWQFAKVEVSEEAIALKQAEYAEYLRQKNEFESNYTELLGNREKFEEVLYEVFTDSACTQLSAAYESMSAEEIRAALEDKLPATLVNMAAKIKSNEWTEANEKADKPEWNSHYAKKFRVQMIEPHSIAGEITEWIGHQGHTNMDNPTGLYANNLEVLYIMVEGEVKEGAELYATWITGHSKMPNYNNGYSNGISLTPGLNIVPIRKDGSAIYINYLVHTFNKDTWKFANKLSDYDDLKIHIEGGYINGYYNVEGDALYTPDNDDDWVYYEERANLENITILGRYEVLQFELNDIVNYTDDKGSTWSHRGLAKLFPEELPTNMPNSPAFTAPNQRINAIVEAWDRIFLSEKMTLGIASKADVDSMNKLFPRYDATWTEKAEIYNYDDALYAFCDSLNDRDGDYGEYYNHRGVAFGTRTGYMYGSWDHSGYHINTTPSILTCIATEPGPAWGPAHEIGHQHQALYTLNGEMEVTNNTFSNIAVWYMGMGTSRVNGTEGNLAHAYDNFKDGGFLLSNNIWVLTQRYYRLWLYYHRVGNNTQFFPRLFELLRKNPMQRSYGSVGKDDEDAYINEKGEKVGYQLTNGYRSYLHFYKLCCEAAQEDLTEFFRAYGCFTPVDGAFVGDYTNSKYYLTQKEIDKAIAEVKAKGYPVNNKVLFINDATTDRTYGHDGTTPRAFWDPETSSNGNAEVGCYLDYLTKDTITGKYLYTLENLKVTIKGGDGAVGFAIYNNDGEIQAFSNNHNFYITNEVLSMLRTGEATMYAVTATGEDIAIANSATIGNSEAQFTALQEVLELAKKYLGRTDTTGTQIGFLIPDSIKSFSALVAKVDEVIANKDTTEYSYGEWFANLDAAVAQIQTNTSARVPFLADCFYSIALSSNANRYMGTVTAGLNTSTPEEVTDNTQWKIVPSGVTGTYYIQNRETGNFISVAQKGQRAKAASSDIAEAVPFILIPDAPGEFFIQHAETAGLNLYNNGSTNRVQAGEQTGNNAKWLLRLEESLLAQPEISTNEQITIYHMQRTDNREYAYHKSAGRTDKGRITSGALDNMDNFNYWFYFTEGNAEGTYAIYN
ncbi:MAG: M60 family metallopeptidase, partial [Bacteroidaceae bacterium]|nr:M60 family metallopeptidase [Bacteroidaceae bacterium]